MGMDIGFLPRLSLEDLSADSEQVMANSQLAAFVGVYHERWRSADHPTLPKSTKASRLKLLAEQVNFEFERRLEGEHFGIVLRSYISLRPLNRTRRRSCA
jgi:hypothetical protein